MIKRYPEECFSSNVFSLFANMLLFFSKEREVWYQCDNSVTVGQCDNDKATRGVLWLSVTSAGLSIKGLTK